MASVNEAQTRYSIIDPALRVAGWDIDNPDQVAIELPVDGYDAEPWNGVTDYCLYRENGEVLAVVEAKRQRRDPNVAREQARHYVKEIGKTQPFEPFAFLTNGVETYFWEVEHSAPRLVAGFFTREDLENRLTLHREAIPLADIPINQAIVGRTYQHEAIRRLSEALTAGKRRALVTIQRRG